MLTNILEKKQSHCFFDNIRIGLLFEEDYNEDNNLNNNNAINT